MGGEDAPGGEMGKKILIIEDEAHIAEGLRLNCGLQGYEGEIAENGVDGLEKWRAWRPDLIILDVMLPGMDGLTVLRTIRAEDEKLPHHHPFGQGHGRGPAHGPQLRRG